VRLSSTKLRPIRSGGAPYSKNFGTKGLVAPLLRQQTVRTIEDSILSLTPGAIFQVMLDP
jgi:hypothetical protein